jgi:hypothetical protein
MVSAEDALKSYGDFMTGGVWTRKNDEGEEFRHSYRWVLNGHFVQFKILGEGPEGFVFIGVDPNTFLRDGSIRWGLGQWLELVFCV